MTLNDHINKILNDHTSTVYHAGCGPSLVTQLALRVRELETDLSGVTHRRDLMADELFEQLQAADARVKELEAENADILSDLGEQRDSNVSVAALWEAAVVQVRDLSRDLGYIVAQITDERDLARSAVNLLRGAVQDHHDRHYQKITSPTARPTNAPHDQALYNAAGIYWIKPEAWDHDPSTYRLAGMRAHWARKQTDAITAADPVRVDDTPEQMG